MDLVAGQMEGF